MLLTSMASALAAAWAVHVVLTPKWLAAGAAGMVWGVAIASLDRMVVTSIRRGHRRRNLFVIIPHVVLSVLLALLIATPIALRISPGNKCPDRHDTIHRPGILLE